MCCVCAGGICAVFVQVVYEDASVLSMWAVVS